MAPLKYDGVYLKLLSIANSTTELEERQRAILGYKVLKITHQMNLPILYKTCRCKSSFIRIQYIKNKSTTRGYTTTTVQVFCITPWHLQKSR